MSLQFFPDWVLVLVTVVISCLGTRLFINYALRARLMDECNERSSHVIATPRGGGVAIVAAYWIALWCAWLAGQVEHALVFTLVGGVVALAGFVDDHRDLSPGVRLVVHFLAALLIVLFLGEGLPGTGTADSLLAVWWPVPLVLVAMVWLLNLYNFMDGIDGLAAMQAIFVLLAAVVLMQSGMQDAGMASLNCMLLAAAVAGFLYWNWPPARIFMGDVGSGFLGIMIAAIAWDSPLEPVIWLMLLAVFICDATYTLLRRMLAGHRLTEAHCTHAYQVAAREWESHRRVMLMVLLVNVCWVFPWAWLVTREHVSQLTGVLMVYLPLLICIHVIVTCKNKVAV